MPANLTTFAHLSVSSAMNFPNRRRHHQRDTAELGEARFHIEISESRIDLIMQPVDNLDRRSLIPFPHQNDLTMYGKDVMDFTSSGLRLM
jgi:hypothetical protein